MNLRHYAIVSVAKTGEGICNFSPYVASISDDGTVAFQATLVDGGTILMLASAKQSVVLSPPNGEACISHPDINARGDVCVYTRLADGRPRLRVRRSGEWFSDPNLDHTYLEAGPLGPTMDEAGRVAFRATDLEGIPAIWCSGTGRPSSKSRALQSPSTGFTDSRWRSRAARLHSVRIAKEGRRSSNGRRAKFGPSRMPTNSKPLGFSPPPATTQASSSRALSLTAKPAFSFADTAASSHVLWTELGFDPFAARS